MIIPKSVKTIEYEAFNKCKNLFNVTLQDGLEKIGAWCFSNTLIREIVIPKSVKSIGDSAFHGCKNLTSVIL